MSPLHEISGERDLTISQWHRRTFGPEAMAFDLDLVGMCGACPGGVPLYVMENTRAANKRTTWTTGIAERLQIPAFLVTYSTPGKNVLSHMHVELLTPQRLPIGDQDVFAQVLTDVRDHHWSYYHPGRTRRY